MPAERTKASRRGGADEIQLVWSTPIEQTTIAFAENLTPVTFNDPPPLVDGPPCESILFPSPEGMSPRRPGHSRKKPENHIPRPPNAFILFRSSFIKSQHVSTEVETNHSTLSKIIGLTWQNLPNDERQIWHAKAKVALEEHKRKFPQYAFRPSLNKGKGSGGEKRKVREVGPKDLKRCAKIAELLVEGKKGQELDAAILEFDKHHVPEVVTRFDAPMTARMYRRSSSVPLLEPVEPFLSSTSHPSYKQRSSSSQPTRESTPTSFPSASSLSTESISDAYDVSSFDQFTLTKEEPSFDFKTFSFDSIVSSVPSYSSSQASQDIDPLSPLRDVFGTHNPSNLSIDTSFNMDAWTRCSSPSTNSTPTTPSYIDDSSFDIYSSYPLDTLDNSLDLPRYSLYPNDCASAFVESEIYPTSPSPFSSFEEHQPKSQMAQADLDFSAFMASLPQYSL